MPNVDPPCGRDGCIVTSCPSCRKAVHLSVVVPDPGIVALAAQRELAAYKPIIESVRQAYDAGKPLPHEVEKAFEAARAAVVWK